MEIFVQKLLGGLLGMALVVRGGLWYRQRR